MKEQPTPLRSVQYWNENGTIQVGAERVDEGSQVTGSVRRERLKKAVRAAEASRTVSVLIPVANMESCDDMVAPRPD